MWPGCGLNCHSGRSRIRKIKEKEKEKREWSAAANCIYWKWPPPLVEPVDRASVEPRRRLSSHPRRASLCLGLWESSARRELNCGALRGRSPLQEAAAGSWPVTTTRFVGVKHFSNMWHTTMNHTQPPLPPGVRARDGDEQHRLWWHGQAQLPVFIALYDF